MGQAFLSSLRHRPLSIELMESFLGLIYRLNPSSYRTVLCAICFIGQVVNMPMKALFTRNRYFMSGVCEFSAIKSANSEHSNNLENLFL